MTNNTHSTILRTIIERAAAAIDPSVAIAFVNDELSYGRNRFFLSVTDASDTPHVVRFPRHG